MKTTIEKQVNIGVETIYSDALTIISNHSDNVSTLLLDLNFSMYKIRLSKNEISIFDNRLNEAEKFINSKIELELNSLRVINNKISETFRDWLVVDPKEDVKLASKICNAYIGMESQFFNFKEYIEANEILDGQKELEAIKIKLLSIFPVEMEIVMNNKSLKEVV